MKKKKEKKFQLGYIIKMSLYVRKKKKKILKRIEMATFETTIRYKPFLVYTRERNRETYYISKKKRKPQFGKVSLRECDSSPTRSHVHRVQVQGHLPLDNPHNCKPLIFYLSNLKYCQLKFYTGNQINNKLNQMN